MLAYQLGVNWAPTIASFQQLSVRSGTNLSTVLAGPSSEALRRHLPARRLICCWRGRPSSRGPVFPEQAYASRGALLLGDPRARSARPAVALAGSFAVEVRVDANHEDDAHQLHPHRKAERVEFSDGPPRNDLSQFIKRPANRHSSFSAGPRARHCYPAGSLAVDR
jgi:hypothetical protein